MIRVISEVELDRLFLGWETLVDVVAKAAVLDPGLDYEQPLKVYLRWPNSPNRIIAMPARVGGSVRTAGIKWISSFPGNLASGLTRADCVTILNDPQTGKTRAIVLGEQLSIWRTSAVSGVLLREFARQRASQRLSVGIVGYGPIGRAHHAMVAAALGANLGEVLVTDSNPRLTEENSRPSGARFVSSWREIVEHCDVVITCTNASDPFIDQPLKANALALNVSLRDFAPSTWQKGDVMIVDDWDDVCREGTFVHRLYAEQKLSKADTITLREVVSSRGERIASPARYCFSPMGMGIFDLAVAQAILSRAHEVGVGVEIPAKKDAVHLENG